jgi:hypothetical protein
LAVPYGAVPVDAGVVLDADVDDASARLDSAAPLDTGVSVDTGVDDASSHLDSAVDADANETQDASVDDASASLDSAAPFDAHVEDHITIHPVYRRPHHRRAIGALKRPLGRLRTGGRPAARRTLSYPSTLGFGQGVVPLQRLLSSGDFAVEGLARLVRRLPDHPRR